MLALWMTELHEASSNNNNGAGKACIHWMTELHEASVDAVKNLSDSESKHFHSLIFKINLNGSTMYGAKDNNFFLFGLTHIVHIFLCRSYS